jgi:hypothetical protein
MKILFCRRASPEVLAESFPKVSVCCRKLRRAIEPGHDRDMYSETVEGRATWFVFVGIRRQGGWLVKRAEQLGEEDLTGVDLLNDFQSASTHCDDLAVAAAKIAGQATAGNNPFLALVANRHVRPDLGAALEIVWAAASRMMHRR